MRSDPLGERRKDHRLHQFALLLGALLALLFHVAVLWGPEMRYRPVLEEARVRRVMVTHPYQPAPPRAAPAPNPELRQGTEPLPEASALEPSLAPRDARPATLPDPGAAGGSRSRLGVSEPERSTEGVHVASTRDPQKPPAASSAPGIDEWTAVLAELRAKGQELAAKPREDRVSREAAEAPPEEPVRGEGFLDPRIRLNVVSYPPTSVEASHPPILYPDLRVRKANLKAGICRVYYRVWTDDLGRVARDQLKTPASAAEQERYAPFVEAVTDSVRRWPFDRVEAEVHVDVLFEIE